MGAYTAIALGTLLGGWRIVHTMGSRITKLRPVGGCAAETGGAIAILIATRFGIPVSTTHTITGAIVGVGAVTRLSAVRWGVASRIVWAWVLTIPAATVSAISFCAGRLAAWTAARRGVSARNEPGKPSRDSFSAGLLALSGALVDQQTTMGASRRFVDSSGFLWQALEICGADAMAHDSTHWLYFLSRGTRRLRSYPSDWTALSWTDSKTCACAPKS
jgi:hypothetical protein